MSDLMNIANRLVELCKTGQNEQALDELYGSDVVSVEAFDMGDTPRALEGIEAVKGKTTWWLENHEVHSSDVSGPYPHGEDRFAVIFNIDITFKPTGQRTQMVEVGVYTVADGKITREEFFYQGE